MTFKKGRIYWAWAANNSNASQEGGYSLAQVEYRGPDHEFRGGYKARILKSTNPKKVIVGNVWYIEPGYLFPSKFEAQVYHKLGFV